MPTAFSSSMTLSPSTMLSTPPISPGASAAAVPLSSALGSLRRDRCVAVVTVREGPRDPFSNDSFDRVEILSFALIAEGDRDPTSSSPARSTDPVNIALWFIRQIEVENMTHRVDVKPS